VISALPNSINRVNSKKPLGDISSTPKPAVAAVLCLRSIFERIFSANRSADHSPHTRTSRFDPSLAAPDLAMLCPLPARPKLLFPI
jgi:hypothetical protein